jgi:succinate dehydrogenase / fumarate reductase cytochrome b subunit
MSKANRPLSPHLQVYRLPLTAKMSISFRFMGIGLAIGFVFLTSWLIAAGAGRDMFEGYQAFFTSWFGLLLLFGWTAAFYFHACNGIRHLVWDTGRGLNNEGAAKSGPIVLGATVVLTVITWIIGLAF